MNRVASDLFPNNIHDVLLGRGQYGRFFWTGIVWPERSKNPSEMMAVQRAYDTALRILNGYRPLPDDVIWQAEFPQGKEVVIFIDGMYFCR